MAIRTSSTIIFLQFSGKAWEWFLVVIQNDALVLEANSEYFFEWKKVISFLVAVLRSFTSKILNLSKIFLVLMLDNFNNLLIP